MSEEKSKLTFWQSVENFWYYYKWRVLVVILLLLAIRVAIPLFADKTKTTGDLTIVSVLSHPLTAEEYNIDKKLQETVNDTNADGVVSAVLRPYYITETRTSDEDLMSQAKVDIHLKNAQGDLLIFDKPNLDFYLKKDIFAPLDNFVDLSSIPQEDIIYQNGVAVAVKLSESKILRGMSFIIDEVYASVMFIPDNADEVTYKSRENTKRAIEKLLER